MTASPPALRIALYEGAGGGALEAEARFHIVRALLERGYPVTRGLPASDGAIPDLLVLGRLEGQPPEWGSDGQAVYFREIADLDADGVVALVEAFRAELEAPAPGGWKPWFPVIDYDRCTNCMQCLSFCLFDVYSVREGKIRVQNQEKCKTDCPACSRVCPEVAILFPKYRNGPINGAEIDPEDLRREAMKVDISALLGGDIYEMLRDRSAKAKSRFAKERDEERALKERQRCLAKLQEQLDIPPEVLAALPSAEQINAKAQRAESEAGGG